MNILVTGGAGFIGSHLTDALIKGNKIFCVDNISSGNCKNVEHLMDNANFKFIEHDVKNPLAVREPIDQIYHLASRASPVDFKKYPVDILLSNSFGTYNMLKLAKEKKARMLFTSTSEVYGDPLEHPQKETYNGNVNCINERSCYDESKRFGEALCMAFYREHKVDVRIARIFNTYGPRIKINDGRVMPNFIDQALNNKPLTVYGDGKQTRSFCYVSDMVDGLIKLMNSKFVAEPFNLGNPNEMTILELAKHIIRLTNSDSEIVFKPLPPGDPSKRKPDISKAKKTLNWEPKVGLEEGLKRTIDYFKNMM